tara:strand:+ start:974 stop:1345 length:372 start_codon:yes stop_codon:yes gene_type:complete
MELKDWLNSINFTKEDLSEDIKQYAPFVINKCMSGHIDTVMYANEMNMAHYLSKDMQYQFFINIVRKRKRFAPWLRKNSIEDISVIQKYYGYSFEKAQQALKILSKEQIDYIKKKFDLGGKSK